MQLSARSRTKQMHEPSAFGRILRNVNYWLGGLTKSGGKRFNPDWVYEKNVVADYPPGDPPMERAA